MKKVQNLHKIRTFSTKSCHMRFDAGKNLNHPVNGP